VPQIRPRPRRSPFACSRCGTNYAPLSETETYDGSSGQETSYTYTAASGDPVTCTYNPRDGGPDFPLRHSVKEDITIAVSGTLPTTGYAVSREILLESISL
jgi:hypothetical protein